MGATAECWRTDPNATGSSKDSQIRAESFIAGRNAIKPTNPFNFASRRPSHLRPLHCQTERLGPQCQHTNKNRWEGKGNEISFPVGRASASTAAPSEWKELVHQHQQTPTHVMERGHNKVSVSRSSQLWALLFFSFSKSDSICSLRQPKIEFDGFSGQLSVPQVMRVPYEGWHM